MNDEISKIVELADQEVEKGNYEAALALYRDAVSLVPDPFEEQKISVNLLTAIGDVYWFMKDYDLAEEVFNDVMLCADAPANPYVRLRRGQIKLEKNDERSAGTELACAFMNGGEDVFKGEDNKYIALVRSIIPK